MKYITHLFFLLSFSIFSQQKEITLQEIYTGKFRTEKLQEMHALSNGKEFVVVNYDEAYQPSIDVYDYSSFSKKRTLISSTELSNFRFDDYKFSPDEQKILLASDTESIFRHSQKANYYVFDLKTQQKTIVFNQKIQEPLFSPDGTKIAFAYQNNLYIKDLQNDKITQITFDGKDNEIINGITDWVYEEEFSIVRMFDWSSDSQKIAFIRFDQRNVPEFSMDIYGKELYPKPMVFKYPKAGENNSKVNALVYYLSEDKLQEIELNMPYYIPRLQWTKDPNVVSLQTMNRHQNDFNLLYYNVLNKKTSVVYSEKNTTYVEIPSLHILSTNNFLISSEKDGFNHIYLYSKEGKQLQQLTRGNWEVTDFYGFDEKSKTAYYQSTERGAINRDVYAISLKATQKMLLTEKKGINDVSFSADFSYFIETHQSATEPPIISIFETKTRKKNKQIIDNQRVKKLVDNYTLVRKEFQVLNINGNNLNMWMLKPSNFDATKKYPVLMYQYSGPGSQSVQNEWFDYNDYWHLLLTQRGYIVVCVDGRGTGAKGADFKKITQFQLGKYEVEDQIKTAEYLSKLPYVDASRIGIWGWSFGGFTSANCILKGNHIFKMAIAVAPVTNWRFYDTIYTERYMKTPAENPQGYDQNSPLNYTQNLIGKFLLIHGSADDNVHLQNTMHLVESLIQHNKSFQWFIYPDKNHSIYGGNTRIHLFEEMTKFVLENL